MTTTIHAAVLLPSPSDTAGFDTDDEWQRLSDQLLPFVSAGRLTLRRIKPATENALRKCLDEGPVDVLHIIGYAQWRTAAQYGTLMLEGSTGAGRGVSTQYLGRLLADYVVTRAVILQLKDIGGERFEDSAQTLWAGDPPAVVVSGAFNEEHRLRIRGLYEHLVAGETLPTTVPIVAAAAPLPPVTVGIPAAAPQPPLTLGVAATEQPPAAADRLGLGSRLPFSLGRSRGGSRRAAEEVRRKRKEQAFDVFLCHNNLDKSKVRKIASSLEARGILPWLDERDVPPGRSWPTVVEKLMTRISSAAVFVGRAGVGPWQEQELYVLLSEFISRQSPVIPVLLDDAPEAPALPPFLRTIAWVDFRCNEPDPMSRLIWGITGKRSE